MIGTKSGALLFAILYLHLSDLLHVAIADSGSSRTTIFRPSGILSDLIEMFRLLNNLVKGANRADNFSA